MTIDPTTLRSIAQAAKSTPYSEPQIRDRIKDGRLNGAIYVHVDDLDEYLKHYHLAQ